jgi:hypothetical protein
VRDTPWPCAAPKLALEAVSVGQAALELPAEVCHAGPVVVSALAQAHRRPVSRDRQASRPSGALRIVICWRQKRTGWDSNPRYPYGYTGFRDRLLQPLGHLSWYELNQVSARSLHRWLRVRSSACFEQRSSAGSSPRSRDREAARRQDSRGAGVPQPTTGHASPALKSSHELADNGHYTQAARAFRHSRFQGGAGPRLPSAAA